MFIGGFTEPGDVTNFVAGAAVAPIVNKRLENYHIVYGNDTFLKVNSHNRLCGIDRASSASVFKLEKCADHRASGDTFRIRYGNLKCYVSQCDGDSVQVTTTDKGNVLYLTLDESANFSDWEKYGDQLKIAADGRYLGYCCKTGLVKIFPSDTVEKPGVVLTLSSQHTKLVCQGQIMKFLINY